MKETTTSGRDAPMDTTLADGFTSDTSMGINILQDSEEFYELYAFLSDWDQSWTAEVKCVM